MSEGRFNVKYVELPSDGSLGTSTTNLPVLSATHPYGEEGRWSYSAVVAAVNALSLKPDVTFNLPGFGSDEISADALTNALGEYIFEANIANMDLAMQLIGGVNDFVHQHDEVEWACTYGLKELQADLSDMFKGLGIPVLNGTVMDPTRMDEFSICVGGENRDVLKRKLASDNVTPAERDMLEMARRNYRPLTPYGYRMVQQNVEEGQVCILVFGGRFFTVVKRHRQLYFLVTDAALNVDSRAVWKRLDKVYAEEDAFLDPNFNPVMVAAEIDDYKIDLDWGVGENEQNESLAEYRILGHTPEGVEQEEAALPTLDEQQRAELDRMMSDSNPADPADDGTGEDEDLALAMRLQQEESLQAMSQAVGGDMREYIETMENGGAPAPVPAPAPAPAPVVQTTAAPSARSHTMRPASQSSPKRPWNLDIVVGLEVRMKHNFESWKESERSPKNVEPDLDWEQWQHGANVVRHFLEHDILDENDLFGGEYFNLSQAMPLTAFNACERMLLCEEDIIPKEMRRTAEIMYMEESLTHQKERACLTRLLRAEQGGGNLYEEMVKDQQKRDRLAAENDEQKKSLRHRYIGNIVASLKEAGAGCTFAALKQRCFGRFFHAKDRVDWIDDVFVSVLTDMLAIDAIEKDRIDGETKYYLGYQVDSIVRKPRGTSIKMKDGTVCDVHPGATMSFDIVSSDDDDGGVGDDAPALSDDDDDDDRPPALLGEPEKPRMSRDEAAVLVQSWARRASARQRYEIQRELALSSASTIQASCRRYMEKKHYDEKRAAATYLAATSRRFLARKCLSTAVVSVTKISAVIRGFAAKQRYGPTIKEAFEDWKRVNDQWKPIIVKVEDRGLPLFSWHHLKDTYDINPSDEDQKNTARIDAARDELSSSDEEEEQKFADTVENDRCDVAAGSAKIQTSSSFSQECDRLPSSAYENILLTQAVLKWFKRADPKFKGFFLRRMRQFANGEYERSQKLRKNLTGSKHIIYEAYLEQKVAQRIMFTECRTKNENDGREIVSILVWYVAKHDDVSRNMKKIDNAEARMNRQFTTAASELIDDGDADEDGAMILTSDTILPDPDANTPLKIHQLPATEIDKLEQDAWTPPFRLTNDERKIVQTPGTVLVLGRSGTGKTVCIVNRMVYDATFHKGDTKLKQLFISRSHRIKNLVQKLVDGEMPGVVMDDTSKMSSIATDFLTYERIIRDCNENLTRIGQPTSVPSMENAKQERDFSGFKDFFISIKKEMRLKQKLSALVVWTQIRTFIKGSIEAVMHGRHLTPDEYQALGTKYCRLNKEQRQEAYQVYERYSGWLEEGNYFDSCDRTIDLLNRLRRVSFDDRINNNLRFDKIYIDECQDFTSADFALFWTLCEGGGDLFLAGDTAQSVEQGISFRFEEVKRVFYEMGEKDRSKKSGIPSKPITIHINFRSHAGVLEVAAEVLNVLHEAFPGAANKLRGDEGLFKGPRPSILDRKQEKYLGIPKLHELLERNPALVILTPDENKEALKEKVGADIDGLVILGICEAKGLDFDDIVIVDFFCSASNQLGKAWKELFRTFSISDNNTADKNLQHKFPELEMRLKLLYTAITRSRHRLWFAETNYSDVGDAFSRWGIGTELMERQDVADLSLQLKSADEWRALGIEYAINAEIQESAEEASDWFKRASAQFKRANDERLVSIAEAQSSIRTKANIAYDKEYSEMREDIPNIILESLEGRGFIDEAIEMCENLLDRCLMSEKKLKEAVGRTLNALKSAKDRMEKSNEDGIGA